MNWLINMITAFRFIFLGPITLYCAITFITGWLLGVLQCSFHRTIVGNAFDDRYLYRNSIFIIIVMWVIDLLIVIGMLDMFGWVERTDRGIKLLKYLTSDKMAALTLMIILGGLYLRNTLSDATSYLIHSINAAKTKRNDEREIRYEIFLHALSFIGYVSIAIPGWFKHFYQVWELGLSNISI